MTGVNLRSYAPSRCFLLATALSISQPRNIQTHLRCLLPFCIRGKERFARRHRRRCKVFSTHKWDEERFPNLQPSQMQAMILRQTCSGTYHVEDGRYHHRLVMHPSHSFDGDGDAAKGLHRKATEDGLIFHPPPRQLSGLGGRNCSSRACCQRAIEMNSLHCMIEIYSELNGKSHNRCIVCKIGKLRSRNSYFRISH